MKKLEIETTKPTFIISTIKTDILKVGLVFSISNFFITKTSLANNWRRKKIPSCSNLALVGAGSKSGPAPFYGVATIQYKKNDLSSSLLLPLLSMN